MNSFYDMANMCRICEKQSNFIILSHPDNQRFVEKLLACANVTFNIDDELPKNLCENCTNELENAYRFKEKCESSQKKYEQLLVAQKDMNIEKTDQYLDLPIKTEYFIDDYYDENVWKIVKTEPYVKNKTNTNRQISELPKNFICDICNSKYAKKFKLEQHMINKHKMAQNLCECQYCGIFVTGKRFTQHLHKHEKPFICDMCSMQFSLKTSLLRHIQRLHENPKEIKPKLIKNSFKCDHCDKIFDDENNLKKHKSINALDFKCNQCCKSFDFNHELQRHLLTHLPESEKVLCTETRIDQKTIDKERLKLAKNDNKPEHKTGLKQNITRVCQYCGITMSSTYFYQHLKNHTNHKQYKCLYCSKCFKSNPQFHSHIRTHTGDKRYKCNICDMSFIQSQHLTRHKRIHTGERPFKCNFCDKTFAQSGTRTTHMRIHTGERPFKCNYCEKTFARTTNRIKHMRIHTREKKPFQCEQCEKGFIDLKCLRKHFLKQHK